MHDNDPHRLSDDDSYSLLCEIAKNPLMKVKLPRLSHLVIPRADRTRVDRCLPVQVPHTSTAAVNLMDKISQAYAGHRGGRSKDKSREKDSEANGIHSVI